jgi:hypothetical protein
MSNSESSRYARLLPSVVVGELGGAAETINTHSEVLGTLQVTELVPNLPFNVVE